MKETSQLISVVICTYNNFASLGKTLAHLAKQDAFRDQFEIVVVTNNCTDQTANAIEIAKVELPNLRSVNEPKQGQVFARICGVKEARFSWIAFVDDDNLLEPDWITQALQFVKSHPSAGIMGGKIDILWEIKPPKEIEVRSYAYAATDISPEVCRLHGEKRWLIRGAGLLCRKDTLYAAGWLEWQANIGRVKSKTTAGDDTEIIMRVAREGWQVWYNPACKMNHLIIESRLNLPYFISLHHGFGLADANLLALKTRQGYLSWALRYLNLILHVKFALVRHVMAALFSPAKRLNVALTWNTGKGVLGGFLLFKRMGGRLRAKCLGISRNKFRPAVQQVNLRLLHLQSADIYGGIQQMLFCFWENRNSYPNLRHEYALNVRARLGTMLEKGGATPNYIGRAGFSKPFSILSSQYRLYKLLTDSQYDFVICHGSTPFALYAGIIKLARLPVVMWMHNDIKTANKNITEYLVGQQTPDLVICNSLFTAESLPLQFPKPGRIPIHKVINCPVSDPKIDTNNIINRQKIRKSLDTDMQTVVIVMSSRLETWKGHLILLKALVEMRDLSQWTCWIAGGVGNSSQAEYLMQLQRFAKENDIFERLRFLGESSQISEVLAAADIHSQPNLTSEPFGIAFVEALYAGLPIVTSDLGSIRDIVNDDCGRLVAPNNSMALASVLRELILNSQLRKKLGANASKRALNICNPSLISEFLHKELVQVLERKSFINKSMDSSIEKHILPL